LGHTFWQDIDATALSGVAAQVLKYAVGRARPYQGDDPNAFFKGSHYQSFPSGEVTLQAAFVTPLIVNYYQEDPWVWALEALPVYDANEFTSFTRRKLRWQWDQIEAALAVVKELFGPVASMTNAIHARAVVLARERELSVYDALIVASTRCRLPAAVQ
jgi:predicted nucleic acid-binding protein